MTLVKSLYSSLFMAKLGNTIIDRGLKFMPYTLYLMSNGLSFLVYGLKFKVEGYFYSFIVVLWDVEYKLLDHGLWLRDFHL
jgi:hypothetical protein